MRKSGQSNGVRGFLEDGGAEVEQLAGDEEESEEGGD